MAIYSTHYRQEHLEEIGAYNRHYYQEHRQEIGARYQRYRKIHRARLLADNAQWREQNREHSRRYAQKYRKENPEAVRNCKRRWQQANAEKRRFYKAHYRAQKAALPNTLRPQEVEELFAIGRSIYPGEILCLDHIVPISKGGGTTRANIHAIPIVLNSHKHTKLPEEIYEQATLEI